jgi:hypothetical protein
MSYPVPPRPDAPTVWPRRTWPVVLAVVASVTLNVVYIPMIGRTAERFPNTDAAGMAAMSLVLIDGCFLVFSRNRDWESRETVAMASLPRMTCPFDGTWAPPSADGTFEAGEERRVV